MPSFSIPLSGLNSDSTALNTIANNLSNMNTTGFKSENTTFGDLFYQQIGSNGAGDALQVGTGVRVASTRTDFTSGAISSTSVASDAAIDGDGVFVLDNNGSQLYTRNGTFTVSESGALESSDGLGVMGYAAVNGVVNASGGVSDLSLPLGQIMQPAATSTFSIAENLDSTTAIGGTATGQIQIYDSLGKTYEANITYTNLGGNKWSYAISVPDTLTQASSATATVTNTLTQSSSTTSGVTTLSYTFSTSSGTLATVDPSTNLTITGATSAGGTATITAPTITSGESLQTYAAALTSAITAAGITGVTVSADAGGNLTITGSSTSLSTTGTLSQDLSGNTVVYNFGAVGSTLATVDPSANLTITGPTAAGGTATITAPTVTAGETAATYITALNSALTAAGITGVTITGPTANGQISITSLGVSGSLIQDAVPSAAASGSLAFDSSGNLTTPSANIGGVTFGGLSDNAATLNMTWALYGSSGKGNISQTASETTTTSTTQDGYASGEYNGEYSIGSDGAITAKFSNGKTQTVGQLAIATIANQQGLVGVGSTEYETTLASGPAVLGVAGVGGRGKIDGESLEGSNVNISAEFSNLIIAQRAFEANSKAVTTFDTVTQDTINLIRS